MNQVVDAAKDRFDGPAAWELLKNADSVTVAKGKKVQEFASVADEKEALLQQAMGPSGNLRAPTFQAGNRFLIGFNAELYDEWMQ